MIDKLYEKLIDPQAMLSAMKETLRKVDPNYNSEESAFLENVQSLREQLPEDHTVSLEEYLAEEERDMAECLLYLFWKGVKQNYECFTNPVSKLFLRLDFEDIHQESLMHHFFPVQYDDLGTKFAQSLPAEMADMTEPIISYYSYLQTVAYKLAHYYGFLFGDTFLSKVIPGYFPDGAVSSTYTLVISKVLGICVA